MINVLDIFLVLILLSMLISLGISRIQELIRLTAFQGILVSFVPYFMENSGAHHVIDVMFLLVFIITKGIIIPWLLWFATKKITIKMDLEPLIGYNASIFAGLVMILLSVFISNNLHVAHTLINPLLLPTAFSTISAGLFLIIARKKALTQAVGYLILENGIYLAGSILAKQAHAQYVVEFGILLDILVAVLVMGIIVHRITRSFDDADTIFLHELKG